MRGYDDGGRKTSSAYNNGVSESRSYSAENSLSSISFSGASIGNLSYARDENTNKSAGTTGGTMSGYGFSVGSGYDNEDRLVGTTHEMLTAAGSNVSTDVNGNITRPFTLVDPTGLYYSGVGVFGHPGTQRLLLPILRQFQST